MKYGQYISLISDLEARAATNRKGYEFRVFLLTALGYAYFIGLIILLGAPLPVVGALLFVAPEAVWKMLLYTAKLWWVVIPGLGVYFGFIGSAVRSITARVPDPEGTVIARNDAPQLYDFIERTCDALSAQRPAQILLNDSFNAGVVTMPRIGIFGRKVYLILGLPVMKALSPEQFEAVLCHEIGHISGKHGVFAKWAYQMREAWGRLIDSQEVSDHKLGGLYKRFVEWFFPYFTAYSFVLMREHEKDADRDAAELVGARPLGEALIALETRSHHLENEFWRGIHEENIKSEKPADRLFSRMIASLAFINPDYERSSLAKAVKVPTDFNDSHPALADRLRLIGYWSEGELPELPAATTVDAATYFLGAEASEKAAGEFDTAWDEQAVQTWRARHEHFQEAQKRLDELEQKQADTELTLDELREVARLQTEKEGHAAAKPAIEEAARRFPESGVAWYNLGLLRLTEDDDTGIEHLDKAMELDAAFRYDACQLAFEYLRGKGRLDEAKKYVTAIEEQDEIYEKARKERTPAVPSDTFVPHDLPQAFIDLIPKKLAGMDEIAVIYAAHKKVEHLPELPYRVLFIELRPRQSGDADAKAVLDIVCSRLDTGEVHYFVVLDQSWGDAGKLFDEMPGSRVYDAATSG